MAEAHLTSVIQVDLKSEIEIGPVHHRLPERIRAQEARLGRLEHRIPDSLQGTDRVTVCFFGEGAVAEGEFHESLNLAALWRLPVVFCCENNLYAMGTALARSESQTDLCIKAASFGMPAQKADGMRRLVDEIGRGAHFMPARMRFDWYHAKPLEASICFTIFSLSCSLPSAETTASRMARMAMVRPTWRSWRSLA